MTLAILLALILLNGVFAMSELAVVSTRKARLQEQIDRGDENAKFALALTQDPNRFLSTVQVGISLIGILAGAFGGSAIARDIAGYISNNIPSLANFADEIGFAVIVGFTTYLQLVFGELVPKRIALQYPEQVSMTIAKPMTWLSKIASPLVWFLSKSTELVGSLIGVSGEEDDSVSEYEIISMINDGTDSGDFDRHEPEMVRGVFDLDETQVRQIITPRTELIYLDGEDDMDAIRKKISNFTYSAYPVCNGAVDQVIGVVRAKDLLTQLLNTGEINVKEIMYEPLYVPESIHAADVLQKFKTAPVHMALVIDEHGGVEGVLTLNDIVEEVLGDVDMDDPRATKRDDGTWLMDGHLPISYLVEMLPNMTIPEDEINDYHTLAGFALTRIGHVPDESVIFEWDNYRFEVVDMDGKRIDKLIVKTLDEHEDIQSPDALTQPDISSQPNAD